MIGPSAVASAMRDCNPLRDRHDRSRGTTLSRMAMGKRQRHAKQTVDVGRHDRTLPRTAAHPFYTRLNQILEKAGSVEATLSAILRRRDRMPGLSTRPEHRTSHCTEHRVAPSGRRQGSTLQCADLSRY